ncbi:MAG: hypothetical protein ABII74_10340 [Elusimicrobiota bacterium]
MSKLNKISLLMPFDMGLELDFASQDDELLYRELQVHHLKNLSLEQETFFLNAAINTHFFRFGIGLIEINFEFEGDIKECVRLVKKIGSFSVGCQSLKEYCRKLSLEVIEKAFPYASYRYALRLEEMEFFPIFLLAELPAENLETFIKRHQKMLIGIVSGEYDYESLSDFILEKEPIKNLGYYNDELILIKRYGAVFCSKHDRELLDLLRFTYAQYWSLRSYNYILNRELSEAQILLKDLPSYTNVWATFRRYNHFSKEALEFSRDKLSIVDSLHNLVQSVQHIDSDWRLHTLYGYFNDSFEINQLYQTVDTKMARIESSYNNARDFLSTNFFIILDVIFFLSLAWSIIDTFLLWKLTAK